MARTNSLMQTEETIKEHYRNNYRYDGTLQSRKGKFYEKYWFRKRTEEIVRDLKSFSSNRILEIGCGTGSITEGVAAHLPEARIIATDISPWCINKCKEYYPNSRVTYEIADAFNLPYKAESFDAVIAVEVIEHFLNPTRIFKEVTRVLKRGGIFIINTPSKFHPVWRFQPLRHLLSIDEPKDFKRGGKHFEPIHYSFSASDLKKHMNKNLAYVRHSYIALGLTLHIVAQKKKAETRQGKSYPAR